MFYFIGGAPRLGKTIVTRAVAKHLGVPWISADQIKRIMRSVGDREKYPALFAMENESDMNQDFIDTTTEDAVRMSLEESKVAWLGVDAFVHSHDDPNESYLIEGIGVMPEQLSKLDDIQFRSIFLHQQNEGIVRKKVRASSDPYDWFMSQVSDEAFDHGIQYFMALNEVYLNEAKKYGFDVFEMTENLGLDIEEIKKYFS